MHLKFSIIIPFKDININILKCLRSINKLNYKNFEVILVPDQEISINEKVNFNYTIIPSGSIMPGLKRDLASKKASGDILAFLDDDAQPSVDWLNIANHFFMTKNEKVIGGPGIDTNKDGKNFIQNLSDIFFKSKLFGVPDRYQISDKEKYYDDWPSVNLMIKKDIFNSIGGFNTEHWPGEDTVLCSKLKKKGISTLYVPKLFVYHTRRVNLNKLTKQIFNYGFKRGVFFFEYPNNSRKFKFFIPLVFAFYLSSNFFFTNFIYQLPLIVYFFISIYNYLNFSKNIFGLLVFPIFCIYNHIVYGAAHLFGFLSKILSNHD